jgi:glycosyltransferase involved in cell wall biosynthesis
LWCSGAGLRNSATFLCSLWRWLWARSVSYDVIHVHLAGSPALAAALAAKVLGKRVVVKLGGGRGIGELAASSRTAAGLLKLAALRLLKPQFVAVARELSEEAACYLGQVPVHLIPNGVDTAVYQPAGCGQKAALRRRLGWPESGLGFLYVGRFSPEKRLTMFLEVWSELAKKTAAGAFVAFVGEGIERAGLEDGARRQRLPGRIFIHPPTAEVSPLYAAADVFVLPSVSEGLSNSLLEAMASGLAVLGSRVGGTREAVADGESGFLFEPQDEGDLRRQMRKLLDRPVLAAKLGVAARRAAVERYSMEKVAQAYEELYRWSL